MASREVDANVIVRDPVWRFRVPKNGVDEGTMLRMAAAMVEGLIAAGYDAELRVRYLNPRHDPTNRTEGR